MGDRLCRTELIHKISEIGFVLDELRLFLDTHPDCQAALTDYNSYVSKYKILVKDYTDVYGPLSYNQSVSPDKWQWVKYPWPWECE